MVELFYHCEPIQELMTTLTEWFVKDPTYTKLSSQGSLMQEFG
jgi:hypothetical protein